MKKTERQLERERLEQQILKVIEAKEVFAQKTDAWRKAVTAQQDADTNVTKQLTVLQALVEKLWLNAPDSTRSIPRYMVINDRKFIVRPGANPNLLVEEIISED